MMLKGRAPRYATCLTLTAARTYRGRDQIGCGGCGVSRVLAYTEQSAMCWLGLQISHWPHRELQPLTSPLARRGRRGTNAAGALLALTQRLNLLAPSFASFCDRRGASPGVNEGRGGSTQEEGGRFPTALRGAGIQGGAARGH